MNRTIKFRAWHRGVMTYNNFFNINIGGQIYYLDTTGEWEQDEYNDIILMQYTGLKDISGNEVYEGDILSFNDGNKYIDDVKWDEDYACFYTKYFTSREWRSAKIIGNIYENSELLNQQ